MFFSLTREMLETLDYTIRIGSTPTFLYFNLYLYSAYAAHYVYYIHYKYFSFYFLFKTASKINIKYLTSNEGSPSCIFPVNKNGLLFSE